MNTERTEYVAFGTTRIGYRLRRSDRRRTIAVSVHPDAGVVVTAPKGLRRDRIAAEVRRKAAWIVKQLEWLRRHHRTRPRHFVSGETLLYLGRQYQLRVLTAATVERPVLRFVRGTFRVEFPAGMNQMHRAQRTRRMLIRWYRQHALACVGTACQSMAFRLGVGVASVRVLDMKTRWGSGGPDGQLRFNWRLAMAPRHLIEYAVAHELCHIVHNRHSVEFWRLLSQVLPDWQQRQEELAHSGCLFDL